MESSPRKSNKIRDIVRLQQILKKWKKLANNNTNTTTATTTTTATATTTTTATATGSKSIKFLKKTLSFTDISASASVVPKGYVAVCVGKDLKRFVIPTEYLSHEAFGILLREAEEEFGFRQEGVLTFPCEVDLFEKILKIIGDKSDDRKVFVTTCGKECLADNGDLTSSNRHPQMCR